MARELRDLGFPMHQTTVAKLESGDRPLRVGEAVAVAAVFGMPFEALFHMPAQPGEPTTIAALREQLQKDDEIINESYDMLRKVAETIATQEANRTWMAQQIAKAGGEIIKDEGMARRKVADIRMRALFDSIEEDE
jgi:hypothetical protein